MCAPESEVSFTKQEKEREIRAGDPTAGNEGAIRKIVVGSAPFNNRDIKDLFKLGDLVATSESCLVSKLSFVGEQSSLVRLCDANAVVELHIQWDPDSSGEEFTTTARFYP